MTARAALISTTLAHYESAYERCEGQYHPAASLVGLLKLCQRRWGADFCQGHWLELGCGLGSTFEAVENAPMRILGSDFSTTACRKASMRPNHLNISYEVARLDASWPGHWSEFSGILDAHLLHCLESKEAVARTLAQALKALAPGGRLVAEVMVAHKNFIPDEGLNYDRESGVLAKAGGPVLHLILSSYDWEQMILRQGFSLFYFEVYSHLKFIHNPKRSELHPMDPEVLRFVAIKPTLET